MRLPSNEKATSRVEWPPPAEAITGMIVSAGPDAFSSPPLYGNRTTEFVFAM